MWKCEQAREKVKQILVTRPDGVRLECGSPCGSCRCLLGPRCPLGLPRGPAGSRSPESHSLHSSSPCFCNHPLFSPRFLFLCSGTPLFVTELAHIKQLWLSALVLLLLCQNWRKSPWQFCPFFHTKTSLLSCFTFFKVWTRIFSKITGVRPTEHKAEHKREAFFCPEQIFVVCFSWSSSYGLLAEEAALLSKNQNKEKDEIRISSIAAAAIYWHRIVLCSLKEVATETL